MTGGKCPICKKPSTEVYRPFCCKRCADLDLAKWLNGSYVVPGEEIATVPDDKIEE